MPIPVRVARGRAVLNSKAGGGIEIHEEIHICEEHPAVISSRDPVSISKPALSALTLSMNYIHRQS